jgi:hypothetical protein
MWQDILKRVDIRNEREYEAASLEDRKTWHNRYKKKYLNRWREMKRKQIDKNTPLYQEMIELQELGRFHQRQHRRLTKLLRTGKSLQDYYSKELETNREIQRGLQNPQGDSLSQKEISQEAYNSLTNTEKQKYHIAMSSGPQTIEEQKFHMRMYSRVQANNLPTFASSEHGDSDGDSIYHRDISKEQYETLTDKDKSNYHNRMSRKFKKLGDNNKRKWHSKMRHRYKSKRPTFYSQEEEQKNA